MWKDSGGGTSSPERSLAKHRHPLANFSRYQPLPPFVETHYFVSGAAGNGGSSLFQEGLQEAHQRRDVAGALPQSRLQQVWEQSHVGGGDGAGVDLQQQGHHLEDVGQELCRSRRRSQTTSKRSWSRGGGSRRVTHPGRRSAGSR